MIWKPNGTLWHDSVRSLWKAFDGISYTNTIGKAYAKLILTFHKVLVESFRAFLQKLTQYGKLMEAYFDVQHGQDGKLEGFVYNFIPYVNHM